MDAVNAFLRERRRRNSRLAADGTEPTGMLSLETRHALRLARIAKYQARSREFAPFSGAATYNTTVSRGSW
jgi:hypothetical protein